MASGGGGAASLLSSSSSLSQAHALLLRGTDLVVGVTRLCLSCVQLHRGVAEGAVTWMLRNRAYREYLMGALSGNGKVRIISNHSFSELIFSPSCLH